MINSFFVKINFFFFIFNSKKKLLLGSSFFGSSFFGASFLAGSLFSFLGAATSSPPPTLNQSFTFFPLRAYSNSADHDASVLFLLSPITFSKFYFVIGFFASVSNKTAYE